MNAGTESNGRSGKHAASAGKVACVQRQADRLVVLVGERTGEKVSVSARVVGEGEWGATSAGFAAQGVGRVVCLVPGGETVARAAMVPLAEVEQMVQAASLLAEVQLPDSIPAHRRGAGVLGGQAEGAQVPALLAGWRGEADKVLIIAEDLESSWCPVIGALAALRGAGHASAWFADPHDGSISVLSGTGSKTVARVVIEDTSSAVLWGEGLASTVGEELDEVSMKPRLGLGEGALEALASRVDGVRVTRSWLDVHGPALGAMLIALGMEPALRALGGMKAQAPSVKEHPVLRAATWLGDARHAGWVVAASLVLVLALPIGIAWARVTMLDAKSQSLKKANETRKKLDERAAVYAELASSRWPMTKLLADISQATPLGVVITDLRLEPGQASSTGGDAQGITIDGIADAQEKVYDLQTNLNNAGLFNGVQVKRSDPKADGGVTFNLILGVSNLHGTIAAKEDWDWSAKNLAIRLHGEGASIKTPPAPKPGSISSDSPKSGRRPTKSEPDEASDSKATDRKPAGGVPAELTDATIAKLDKVAAMREMVARRTYPQKNPSLDSATKRRLEEEVSKLKDRIATFNSGGAKAGGGT